METYDFIEKIESLKSRPDDERLKKEILGYIDLLPIYKKDVDTGKTPLIYAIEYGIDDIAQRILEKNISIDDINAVDNDGKTAFIYAVEKNKPEICKLIVKKIKYNLIKELTEKIDNIKRTETDDLLSELFSSKASLEKKEDDLSDLLHSFGAVKIGKTKEEKLQEDIKNMIKGIEWPEDLLYKVGSENVSGYFFKKELKGKLEPYEEELQKIIETPPEGNIILPAKNKFKSAIVRKSPQKRKFIPKDRRSDYKKTIDPEAERRRREQRSLEERKEKREMTLQKRRGDSGSRRRRSRKNIGRKVSKRRSRKNIRRKVSKRRSQKTSKRRSQRRYYK